MSEKNGGWTSPPVLLNIASILMVIIGGYLITKDRNDEALNDLARRLAIVETKQEILWQREAERERRERRE